MTAELVEPNLSPNELAAAGHRTRPTSLPSSPWRDRNGRATRLLLPARPVRPALLESRGFRQIASFAVVGTVSTIAYVALYAVLVERVSDGVANVLALILTALGNTEANRRLTFSIAGRDGLARDHAAGLFALAVALVITTASLAALHAAVHSPSRPTELVVLVAANAAATIVRFLLLRLALDRRTLAQAPERIAR